MKILGGVSWPNDGQPAFLCAIEVKHLDTTKSFDMPSVIYDITHEVQCASLGELFDAIKSIPHLQAVYTKNDTKYRNFIYEYSRWKRSSSCDVRVRGTNTVSFESGVLKIKEFITKKILVFGNDSIIRGQLKIFSKLSLKNESEFFAVAALSNVITSLVNERQPTVDNDNNISDWY
jgi:hypothetical protein